MKNFLKKRQEKIENIIKKENLILYFYGKEKNRLKKELFYTKNEIFRFQSVPLIIGTFIEKIDDKYAIVSSSSGNYIMSRFISVINKSKFKTNTTVILHKFSNSILNTLGEEIGSDLSILNMKQKSKVNLSDIGGLEFQKQELKEAIELPILKKNLFIKIGIDPPKGVLLYGPPGTGKTLIVKAIAYRNSCAFIRTAGSEFVQKYLGEGPKMVRDLFKLANSYNPSIIFIDEIDAIATKRFDANTGADREVQRILIELLTQMDGFDVNSNTKIIMCTNRVESLDPAILRPGRIDRKIYFPFPNSAEKRYMFSVILSKMNISEDLNIEIFINRKEKLTGAIISAICQEAGIQAIRKNRYRITQKDFEISYRLNVGIKNSIPDYYL